ncbi:hypothetical protein [Arthrobacter sp. S39]|uniref:SMP-30/gluconolactonase/LRE family protein n=1 Tax=Arthrobacter sp. S39 TaxID=2509720 RepID=UPI0010370E6E|nr:hypothetical protein [Arthrobacter sp. S39]TAP41859.1 hypothetical protein EYS21_17145 [Arthrobacter sp. S39]
MRRTVQRRTAIAFFALMALLVPCLPAAAVPPSGTVVLDGANSAEGIAAGRGTTFYAGELATGDIFQGDIRTGTAAQIIEAPAGRMAVGMKFDPGTNLLFVAGGGTGKAYVYNTATGQPVAERTLAPGFINDVALTPQGAWFTNSAAGELYFVPVTLGGGVGAVQTLPLSGPAADTSSQFNLNGIASAKGGRVLFVAHSGNGEIYTVNPDTGASALVEGVSVPNVDGIVVQGQRLWAVQNFSNQISRIDLSNNFSSGVVEDVITSPLFNIPATAALFGNTLAAVNAQFMNPDTDYEVVLVPARL